MLDDGGEDADGSVVKFLVAATRQVVVGSGVALSIWLGQVRGASIKHKDHITGMVANLSIGMRGQVVKELMTGRYLTVRRSEERRTVK